MLADPRFWLYGLLFFAAAGAVRLLRNLLKKKRLLGGLAYGVPALCCLIPLFLLPAGPEFFSLRDGALFSLSALLPGALVGLHASLLLLPPLAAWGVAFALQRPLRSFSPKEQQFLGTLASLPSPEGRYFYEWTPPAGPPLLGSLKGEAAAPVIRKEILPGALFFLAAPPRVLGITTRPVSPAELPMEETESFVPLPGMESAPLSFARTEYPALRFLGAGYFNAYSIAFIKGELLVQEGKDFSSPLRR